MGTISVPWDRTAVKTYIDKQIEYWQKLLNNKNAVSVMRVKARYTVDTLQGLRIALFGETDILEFGVTCVHCGQVSKVASWEGRYDDEDRCYYYICSYCGHEVEG